MRKVTGVTAMLFCVCVLVVAGCGSSAASGLYPVHVDGKYGYINKTGSIVIKPQFMYADNFSEGLAAVSENDKYGYIDTSGAMVIQPQFHTANAFSEGLAAVDTGTGKDVRWGFVDKTGRLAIPAQFASVSKFSEGLCCVSIKKDGQDITGFIDKTGTWVIKAGQTGQSDFSDGVALTKFSNHNGDYYAIINQKGKVIAQLPAGMFTDEESRGFSEGLAAVRNLVLPSGLLEGYIDKSGKVVIKLQFVRAYDFSEGLAAASIMENGVQKIGYIDKTGTWVIQPQFYLAHAFSEGLALVCTGGVSTNDLRWGFIDKTGKVVIKLQEKGLLSTKLGFSGGVAGVETYTVAGEEIVSDSMTYINTTGKVIWQGKGLGTSAAGSGP